MLILWGFVAVIVVVVSLFSFALFVEVLLFLRVCLEVKVPLTGKQLYSLLITITMPSLRNITNVERAR